MRNKVKNLLIITIIVSIMLPYGVEARTFKDMPSGPEKEALENVVHNGILQGYNGNIRPNDSLTRAELAAIMNRVLNTSKTTKINKFKDVSKKDWYYKDMEKAVALGLYKGSDQKLHPNRKVSREEAFVVIARAFDINESRDMLHKYRDRSKIANWAINSINGLSIKGYIEPNKAKNLRPREDITRAEVAVLIDRVAAELIRKPGLYTSLESKGNTVINIADAELKGVEITGDVLIADGVSQGSGLTTFNNVKLLGRVLVRGGKRLNIINKSKIFDILVFNKYNDYYVDVEKGSWVKAMEISSPTTVAGEGKVEYIHVKEGGDGSKILVDNTIVLVDEGVKNVTDKNGDPIKPGKPHNTGGGNIMDKDKLLEELNKLRVEARKMKHAEVNEVLNKYKKVNAKSTYPQISIAYYDIKGTMDKVKRDIEAKFKKYKDFVSNEVDKLPPQHTIKDLESATNSILKQAILKPTKYKLQYVLVDSCLRIELSESNQELLFDIKVDDSKFIDQKKLKQYQKLEELRKHAKEMNNKELNEFIKQNKIDKITFENTEKEILDAIKILEPKMNKILEAISERLDKYMQEMLEIIRGYKVLANQKELFDNIDEDLLKIYERDFGEKYPEYTHSYKYKSGEVNLYLEEATVKKELLVRNIFLVDADHIKAFEDLQAAMTESEQYKDLKLKKYRTEYREFTKKTSLSQLLKAGKIMTDRMENIEVEYDLLRETILRADELIDILNIEKGQTNYNADLGKRLTDPLDKLKEKVDEHYKNITIYVEEGMPEDEDLIFDLEDIVRERKELRRRINSIETVIAKELRNIASNLQVDSFNGDMDQVRDSLKSQVQAKGANIHFGHIEAVDYIYTFSVRVEIHGVEVDAKVTFTKDKEAIEWEKEKEKDKQTKQN